MVVPVVYCYLDDLAAWATGKRRKAPPAAPIAAGGGPSGPVPASKMDGLS